eukprot:365749-Chlamydomonas_euryale.AAC.4
MQRARSASSARRRRRGPRARHAACSAVAAAGTFSLYCVWQGGCESPRWVYKCECVGVGVGGGCGVGRVVVWGSKVQTSMHCCAAAVSSVKINEQINSK